MTGTASVSITDSQVNGTGHRVGALGDTTVADPPAPGNGITFESTGEGLIVDTIITGSFGTGLVASPKNVTRKDVLYFDNAKDFTPK